MFAVAGVSPYVVCWHMLTSHIFLHYSRRLLKFRMETFSTAQVIFVGYILLVGNKGSFKLCGADSLQQLLA